MERLVVRRAKENPSWGYDRMVGATANLGCTLSDQTVGDTLGRRDVAAAVSRQKSIVLGLDDLESKTHRQVEELKSA